MRRVHTVRRLADYPAPTPQPTPCRLWQGQVRKGYGYRGDGSRIHRWVMEQALGRPLVTGEIVIPIDEAGSQSWCYSSAARSYHDCWLAPDR